MEMKKLVVGLLLVLCPIVLVTLNWYMPWSCGVRSDGPESAIGTIWKHL
jgi:hypothetical protein